MRTLPGRWLRPALFLLGAFASIYLIEGWYEGWLQSRIQHWSSSTDSAPPGPCGIARHEFESMLLAPNGEICPSCLESQLKFYAGEDGWQLEKQNVEINKTGHVHYPCTANHVVFLTKKNDRTRSIVVDQLFIYESRSSDWLFLSLWRLGFHGDKIADDRGYSIWQENLPSLPRRSRTNGN